MASLTDVLSVVQNGVIAFNNFSKQMAGSLLNISGKISANSSAIAANTSAITALQTPNYGIVNSSGSLGVSLSKITASLGADVILNNTANYFDGPSVAQGSSGTWWAAGTVTVQDGVGAANILCKLWDGTTVIASAMTTTTTPANPTTVSLSGFLTNPAGNIRISCRDQTNPNGAIKFNQTGNSKDSTISVVRIG